MSVKSLDEQNHRENLGELREKQRIAKEEMDSGTSNMQLVSEFIDSEGEVLPARVQGKVYLKMLDIETDIKQVQRFREDDADGVYELQDSIRRYGLLEPVHVVPFGDYYVLLQGYRRLQAHINLGKTNILALVDTTIPPELVKYYQVEVNNVLKYSFIEKLNFGKYVENTQPNLGVDVIEQSLGIKAGEYLKMKYIEQFKTEFPDIFRQVQNERLTVEQAYKKIDKEIEKQEKEMEKEDKLNRGEMDDELKDENDLNDIQVDAGTQERGKRKVLDPVIRRSVESRAEGACECCGYGKGIPDLMGAFQVHHIIPVQYGGSDNKSNLILLCHNCHKLVHDYESARFTPEQETYDHLDEVKRIVVLGNMLLRIRKKALYILRTKHTNIGRQVDKGVYSVGAGLEKANVDVKGEEEFDNEPYKVFKKATEDLKFGGDVTGNLSIIGSEEKDSEPIFDGKTYVQEDKSQEEQEENVKESVSLEGNENEYIEESEEKVSKEDIEEGKGKKDEDGFGGEVESLPVNKEKL